MATADITIPGTNVEQVLRDGGLSRFHKKAILVTGAAWTFVAMEILLVGFVAPTFTAIWHLGGLLVVDPSMLAEYLPPQRRGRLLVFLDFWWPVGLLVATGLSFLFLGPSFDRFGDWSWRYLFLAAAFPAFLAFVVRRTLPESPYYLARQGRSREAADVLEEIT